MDKEVMGGKKELNWFRSIDMGSDAFGNREVFRALKGVKCVYRIVVPVQDDWEFPSTVLDSYGNVDYPLSDGDLSVDIGVVEVQNQDGSEARMGILSYMGGGSAHGEGTGFSVVDMDAPGGCGRRFGPFRGALEGVVAHGIVALSEGDRLGILMVKDGSDSWGLLVLTVHVVPPEDSLGGIVIADLL